MYPFNLIRLNSAEAYVPSAECQAWLNELGSQPSQAFIETIDQNLFIPLVSNGIFSKLDLLIVGAQEVEVHGQTSLVNPSLYSATLVNSPSWTQYEGWTGDGATSYISTNYNPTLDASQFVLNDSSIFAYMRTNDTNNRTAIGAWDGVSPNRTFTLIRGQSGGTTCFGYMTENGAGLSPATDLVGLSHVKRTASNAQSYWKNGSSVASNAAVSTAFPNKDLYLLARNSNGSMDTPTVAQGSIFGAGAGSINGATLSSVLNDFMTELGKNVY